MSGNQPRRVFLSHTSELRGHPADRSFVAAAEAAVTRAGDAVVDMKYFTSADEPPADLCRENVRRCDVYVGVIGFRYGSPVRDAPKSSYTELEFDTATEAGVRRYVFMVSEEAELPRAASFDPKFEARQQRFRRRLLKESGLTVQKFRTPDELEKLVHQALVQDRHERHAPAAGTPDGSSVREPVESEIDKFIVKYRQVARRVHGYISPPNSDDARRVPLEKIYVIPTLEGRMEPSEQEDREIGFEEVAEKARRAVFLGDPGGGKTTLTTKIIYEKSGSPSWRIAPFLVVLRDYNTQREKDPLSVVEYLGETLDAKYQMDVDVGVVDRVLRQGRALVVFDGLDELLEPSARRDMASVIDAFCEVYPLVRVLVTSRRIGYRQAPLAEDVFSVVQLKGFSPTQVEKYVNNWFALDPALGKDECKSLSDGFIRESKLVEDLRSNPLMLALMCSIYRTEAYIPRNRPDVYEKCSRMLFDRWDRHRGLFRPLAFEAHVEPAMMDLAYWIYNTDELQGGVREKVLVDRAADYLQTWQYESRAEAMRAAREFIEFCRGRAWVFTDVGLTPDGESLYQFTHRTFLEYFAASHLAITHEERDLLDLLIEKIRAAEWDVVSQLAIQIKSKQKQGGADRATRILLEALDDADSISEAYNIASFLARSLSFLVPSPATTRKIVQIIVRRFTAHDEANDGRNPRILFLEFRRAARELQQQIMKVIRETLLEIADGNCDEREVAFAILCRLHPDEKSTPEWSEWARSIRQEAVEKMGTPPKSWTWAAVMLLYDGIMSPRTFTRHIGQSGLVAAPQIPGTSIRYISPLEGILTDLTRNKPHWLHIREAAPTFGDILASEDNPIERKAYAGHRFGDSFDWTMSLENHDDDAGPEEFTDDELAAIARLLAVGCRIASISHSRMHLEATLLRAVNLGCLEFARPLLEYRDDWLLPNGVTGRDIWAWAARKVPDTNEERPSDT